jgi:hypothetical protein
MLTLPAFFELHAAAMISATIDKKAIANTDFFISDPP